jgi:phosphoribosylformylglycinamidine cyclo-ligase
MFRTFNMGVGMIWVVDKSNAESIANETKGYIIGDLRKGDRRVELVG